VLNRAYRLPKPATGPPLGIDVFVINSIAEEGPVLESFKGVLPFLVSDLSRVVRWSRRPRSRSPGPADVPGWNRQG
jgi:hypothetical protein